MALDSGIAFSCARSFEISVLPADGA